MLKHKERIKIHKSGLANGMGPNPKHQPSEAKLVMEQEYSNYHCIKMPSTSYDNEQ